MKGLFKSFLGIALIGSAIAAEANTQFPLRMDIDVSARRSTRNIGSGSEGSARVQNVSLRVRIRRASGSPNSQPLTAEVYVIGRQVHTGYYGIIDVVKKDFSFAEERLFEFTTREYSLGRTDGNINVGGTYETFLVVVADENAEILDHRSGRSIRDEGIAFIRELGPATLFDRDGNVVGKVENKNEAFKRAVPSATNPGRNY